MQTTIFQEVKISALKPCGKPAWQGMRVIQKAKVNRKSRKLMGFYRSAYDFRPPFTVVLDAGVIAAAKNAGVGGEVPKRQLRNSETAPRMVTDVPPAVGPPRG